MHARMVQFVTKKKNSTTQKHTERENKTQVEHHCQVGDQVMTNRNETQWKLLPKCDGPYEVVRMHDNGAIKPRKGIIVQPINIRRLVPCHSQARSWPLGSKCHACHHEPAKECSVQT